jgi:hypothetical protein
MNKTVKIFLVIVFIFLSTLTFAQTGSRVYEYNGNFSFCPPLGWEVREFPGLKYKIVVGPVEDQFAVNMNFADEIFNGTLRDYINLNLAQLEKFFVIYRLVDRKTFKTNSGITGECVIINDAQQRFYSRQALYFLPIPNNKYFVVACSAPDEVFEKYQSIFDESIKTFELID